MFEEKLRNEISVRAIQNLSVFLDQLSDDYEEDELKFLMNKSP